MSPSDTPAVEARSLTRRFGEQTVLDSVDFALAAGERLAVTGPNGSGKTTLLRCLAGALAPNDGEVRICGTSPEQVAGRARFGAVIGDHRSFYLRLSARQNLALFVRLRRPRSETVTVLSGLEEELDLGEIRDTPVSRCSSGQVQRLALARALIGDPAALLLDEPTRSMDERSRRLAWEAIDRRPRAAVVLSTHDREETARCSGELTLRGDRAAAEVAGG